MELGFQVPKRMKQKIYIGIDPGVKTGLAIWLSETKQLEIHTMELHEAFRLVFNLNDEYKEDGIIVRVEDARLRKWFGKSGREKLQGAGSVKRDCKAWQEFLEHHKIPHEFISPEQKGAKLCSFFFKKLTGYKWLTSQHGRDAAMLVFKK